MNLKIYKPKLEQISEIIPLWEKQYIFHNELDDEYYVEMSPELKDKFEKHLTESIEKDSPMILVAEINEKIVGFITYEIEENDYMDTKITKYGVIVEMYVDEKYREQGIASKLMNKVEAYFKSQNLSHVEIQLSTYNTNAMKFYSAKGYENKQTFVFKKIG